MQPWICYADITDRVRVWDWTTQQVCKQGGCGKVSVAWAPSGGIHPHTLLLLLPVLQTLHDLQLGGADDEGSMEAALNSINAKDPAFTTNPSALSHAPSRVPSGHIRQV